MNTVERIMLALAGVALVAFGIAANVSFIIVNHRLPAGGGELINWLFGL